MREFNTKQEFIDFIKWQMERDLTPKEEDKYIHNKNDISHILYTHVDDKKWNLPILSFLKNDLGRRVEEHLDGYYWIWIKDNDKN